MKCHPISGVDVRGAKGWVPHRLAEVRAGGSTGRVGSFGMTRSGGTKMHKGTDYLCNEGDPIYAAMDGRVGRSGEEVPPGGKEQDGRVGYGYRIYIHHALAGGHTQPVETRYAHLSGILAKRQDLVRAGELIGWAGRSGNVDNDCPTHLHFEVRVGGNPTDPIVWLKG